MGLKTFSPKAVGLLVGGIDITGWVSLTITRSDVLFTKVNSADGKEIARARNDDRSGQCAIEMQQFADGNAVLDGFRLLDEGSGSGVVTFKMVNKLSGEEVFSTEAWISDVGEINYTNEINTRTWMLDLSEVNYALTPQSNVTLSTLANLASFTKDVF